MTLLPAWIGYASMAAVAAAIALLAARIVAELSAHRMDGRPAGRLRAFACHPATAPDYIPISPMRLWRTLLLYFAASRLLIAAASCSFAVQAGEWKESVYSTLAGVWNEYDSHHYLSIASTGYHADGESRFTLAFYPLYPALIRLLALVGPSYTVSGWIVSNLFLLAAMYYTARLAELETGSRTIALAAAKYMAFFPLSFFFSIVYTESLFVALSVIGAYALRKERWLMAGAFGLLAAVTRNQGVLLAVPIAVELLLAVRRRGSSVYRQGGIALVVRTFGPGTAAVLLPVCGTILYLLVNRLVTGDWFRFLELQRDYWGQTFGFFASNLTRHMERTLTEGRPLFALGVWIPQVVLFFAAFLLLMAMTNKTRLSYLLFSFAYLMISFAPTALLSGARYVSGMFTLYLFMAIAACRISKTASIAADAVLVVLLAAYTGLFVNNYVF